MRFKGHYGFKIPLIPVGVEIHRDYRRELTTGIFHFWNDPDGCFGLEIQARGIGQFSIYRRVH
jgi:hypothetical protein